MAFLILVLMGLAGFHFLYEGILVPTWRLQVRYKIYALRDEIRALKVSHPEEMSDEVFNYLHTAINGTLQILPHLDLTFFGRMQHDLKHDVKRNEQVEKRVHVLESCKLPEVRAIMVKLYDNVFKTITINSGTWALYFSPVVILLLLIVFVFALYKKCQKVIEKSISRIVFSPERIHMYVPQGYEGNKSTEFQF